MNLHDLAGGRDRLLEMTTAFYAKATEDELIGAMFSRADTAHAAHLASWLTASFGGPPTYLATRGDLAFVIWKHAGLAIREEQRDRWATLMLASAAEVGMPPAFAGPFARFVDSVSRSVRVQSNEPLDVMRARLGVPPGGSLEPIVPDPVGRRSGADGGPATKGLSRPSSGRGPSS